MNTITKLRTTQRECNANWLDWSRKRREEKAEFRRGLALFVVFVGLALLVTWVKQ